MSSARQFVSSGAKHSSTPLADRLPLPETIPPTTPPDGDLPVATLNPSLVSGLLNPAVVNPRFCVINLRQGCYRITFAPAGTRIPFNIYHGTMRVDRSNSSLTVSGDLYRFSRFTTGGAFTVGTVSGLGSAATLDPAIFGTIVALPPQPLAIPIYPRKSYYSYLKVVDVQTSPFFTTGPCNLILTIDEFVYTQPPVGEFDGTFPSTRTRRLRAVLSPTSAPTGFTSSFFAGKLLEGSVELGSFSMGWVSNSYRRATLEVDTLVGAQAPGAVGGENFRTVFGTAGWDLGVVFDQTSIPVPSGVTATNCWSSSQFHSLMFSVRKSTTNLDKEWRTHLVVVPGKLGCSRGIMYDSIGVPREGAGSYSDDGYPSTDTASYGTAEGKKQRDVPRAYLRSAAHEVGHAFNQIHQGFESGNDNSIMTPTPSVAATLGSATTGDPGVFPDDINLGFNDTVQHHLAHYPDPVVRPGGHSFLGASPFSGPEADADRFIFSDDQLELRIDRHNQRLKLGEPLCLHWALTNHTNTPIDIPSDISPRGGHVDIMVTNPAGRSKRMGSFILQTDAVRGTPLASGKSSSSETHVYWSSGNGFAFDTPGAYRIELRILWVIGGVPVAARTSTDVSIDYPTCDADNEVAAALFHREVGMVIALGEGAPHLQEGTTRIAKALTDHPDHAACKCLHPIVVKKAKKKPAP